MELNTNLPDLSIIPLTNILLPSNWVLYLYDKQAFKKMANKQNHQAEPYKKLCILKTVNDFIYIMKLMKIKRIIKPDNTKPTAKPTDSNSMQINLDANDYIIMREGIEPVWEDPRNKCGGTFSVKVIHSKGYDTWSKFLMCMVGETLMDESVSNKYGTINGISVSFISDNNFNADNSDVRSCHTFLKIWDGVPNRNLELFSTDLCKEIKDCIKGESTRYILNDQKKDFNEDSIIPKINKFKQDEETRPRRGGFSPVGTSNGNGNGNGRGRGFNGPDRNTRGRGFNKSRGSKKF